LAGKTKSSSTKREDELMPKGKKSGKKALPPPFVANMGKGKKGAKKGGK
jgi:hypothetical protein